MVAYSPPAMSPSEVPGLIGGPPGSPVSERIPPAPCTTTSRAGRVLIGPVCPNPEIEAKISRGLIADNTSYPSPRLAIVPGVKFSTSTSNSGTSCLNSSRPSSCLRSSEMLRLPRFTLKK